MVTKVEFVVFRLQRADAAREYYVAKDVWTDDVRDAKRMTGDKASVLCENLGTRSGFTFLFTVDRFARREAEA